MASGTWLAVRQRHDARRLIYWGALHDAGLLCIALGAALNKVRGTGKGIARYANILLPMDEALCMCALDFSGRPFLVFDGEFSSDSIGGYDTQMTEEFFRAVAFNAGITLHIKIMYGKNDHHKTEACYKAFAKCISQALKLVSDDVPSAKGML